MAENYNFNSSNVYVQSLIHAINLTQSEGSIFVEVGTGHGESICTIAQNCANVSHLFGIDPYVPYDDWLKDVPDGNPWEHKDEKIVDVSRIICKHNIKFSGNSDKIKLIEKPAEIASIEFEDQSIDVVFLDAYSKPEDIYASLDIWYPKVKTGGIFSGHDYQFGNVRTVIDTWRNNNNISVPISSHDKVWCWIK